MIKYVEVLFYCELKMSSRADIRAGISIKRTVTTPPTVSTKKLISRPSLWTVFWFAIAAMFAGLFGWSFHAWKALEAAERDETDVSGYGQCSGTHIIATKAWSWWQSPHPNAPANETFSIPQGFVGKNAVVWSSGENASVHTAHVAAIDGKTITLETSHNMSKECHFTLDANPNPNLLRTCMNQNYEAGSSCKANSGSCDGLVCFHKGPQCLSPYESTTGDLKYPCQYQLEKSQSSNTCKCPSAN